MSEKNTLRMIFFAILFVVIIGGIYTADYAFAESGERDVTLDISMASSADFKIFDKNEREIKKVTTCRRSARTASTFSVFAEEHERIRNIGLPKGKNWFSESAYSKKRYSPPHKSYLYYGEWEFDPLKEELIQ